LCLLGSDDCSPDDAGNDNNNSSRHFNYFKFKW
jgi:hypothetical protein